MLSAEIAASPSIFRAGIKRGLYFDIGETLLHSPKQLTRGELAFFEGLDISYRALCAVLYNYAPSSGHPGGSISSGKIAQALAFGTLDYDFSQPFRKDADMFVYAAGHKAMGLYALWALRNELARIAAPELLAGQEHQMRLEDLLGFRRNPSHDTPLFKSLASKALDGHPTPAVPFVPLATGASGVGVGAGLGLALAAMDIYPDAPPKVHMLDGEGGLTAGRAHEALAAAATNRLHNAVLHLDWNQSSIDSDRVCPENGQPGEYVQWTPAELFHTHDWNVVYVSNGHDMFQVLAAQELAKSLSNKQPTAVIYRTIKGWRYGLQGRTSHGAGHKFASESFYAALEEFEKHFKVRFPRFCGEPSDKGFEKCYWDSLLVFRKALESHKDICSVAAEKLRASKAALEARKRAPRKNAPDLQKLYSGEHKATASPKSLHLAPGTQATLRGTFCSVLGYLNKETNGAFFASAADLAASTSLNEAVKHFGEGFYNSVSNPHSRLVAIGGICEDAMGCVMTGLSSYGRHIGVTSSYASFIAALEHIPARMHAIGQQAASRASGGAPYNTFIMLNAHAGLKTGEDGPSHADPQALQLLQGNFPQGALITLTPWDNKEIWPLTLTALLKRPAVLAPFVTRPPETVPDRKALGLPAPDAAVKGVYPFMKADPSEECDGTVVLQGNGVACAFTGGVLGELRRKGYNLNVFYVASAELFHLLPEEEREAVFPSVLSRDAIGITDFTLPTMQYWIRSRQGLDLTLHPFRGGAYPGSGKAESVLKESGADAHAQLEAIVGYVEARKKNLGCWC